MKQLKVTKPNDNGLTIRISQSEVVLLSNVGNVVQKSKDVLHMHLFITLYVIYYFICVAFFSSPPFQCPAWVAQW